LCNTVTYGEPSIDTAGVVLMAARQCSDHLAAGEVIEANDADE